MFGGYQIDLEEAVLVTQIVLLVPCLIYNMLSIHKLTGYLCVYSRYMSFRGAFLSTSIFGQTTFKPV